MARLRLSPFGLVFSICLASSLAGCAVTDADLTRWEGTQRGPTKLYAVVTHGKYSLDLRTKAALSIIRMPPRAGTRLGIAILAQRHKDEDGNDVDGALNALGDEDRAKIIAGIVPELEREITAPPPARLPDGALPHDPSIPYKDVAFALLSNQPPLVTDPDSRARLEKALATWVQTGFQDRVENSSQQYGVEQMLRYLGPNAAKTLPDLIKDDTTRVDRVVGLAADVGDSETKSRAAAALVAFAKTLESPEWAAAQKKVVEDHNAKTNTKATPEQVLGQVEKIRERRFNDELFPSMKKVGGERQVIDFLLAYAGDAKKPEDRRKLALAALEGRADKAVTSDGDKLFAIAKEDSTPDGVRDLAFTRLGELPKDQVIARIYTLFETPKWKVRWVAGSMVLKMIDLKDLPTFLAKLPATARTKQGMTEGLSFGELIGKMDPKGGTSPKALMVQNLNNKSFGAKMTAIGFFYRGARTDEALLAPLAASNEPVPVCEKDDDCQWQCEAAKPNGAPGSKETATREIKTIGELVSLCVIPSLK